MNLKGSKVEEVILDLGRIELCTNKLFMGFFFYVATC